MKKMDIMCARRSLMFDLRTRGLSVSTEDKK